MGALVLWDLDGTLIDSGPGITGSLRVAFAQVGLPVPDDLRSFVGPPIHDSMRRVGVPTHLVDDVVAAYRAEFGAGRMYDAVVYPGVRDALVALRDAGARLVIATAKPEMYAVPICERFGLTELVDGLFGAPLDESVHKDLIVGRALASVAGRTPERTVMVGDREHDVHAAAAHGVPTVGVSWGYAQPGELVGAGAVAVVDDADGLRAALVGKLGLAAA